LLRPPDQEDAVRLASLLCLLLAACVQQPQVMIPDAAYEPPGPEWVTGYPTPEQIVFLTVADGTRYANFVRIWTMVNRTYAAGPTRFGARSLRVKVEYDCDRPRMRGMRATFFSEPNALGQAVWADGGSVTDWLLLPPGSTGAANARIACGLLLRRGWY